MPPISRDLSKALPAAIIYSWIWEMRTSQFCWISRILSRYHPGQGQLVENLRLHHQWNGLGVFFKGKRQPDVLVRIKGDFAGELHMLSKINSTQSEPLVNSLFGAPQHRGELQVHFVEVGPVVQECFFR